MEPGGTDHLKPMFLLGLVDISSGGGSFGGGSATLTSSTGQSEVVGQIEGMNFGMNNGFWPAVVPKEVVLIPSDFDRDGDVDRADLDHLADCITGPILGTPAFGCTDADLDGDNDVDQSDFGILQRCLTGKDFPSDPACVP